MAQSEPRRKGRRLSLLALQLLLTAVVTWFILRRVGLSTDDLAALDWSAWRPRWTLFLLSCAVLLVGYVASAAIWRGMVRDLGGPRLPLGVASETYLVANLGRYLPGKVWQIAGLGALALRQGVAVAVSTAAAVLGQVLALGGAALVGANALWAGEAVLGGWGLAALALLAAMAAVALIPALQHRAVRVWYKLTRHTEPPVQVSAATTLKWLALYTANWVIYAGSFLALVRSFGLPGPSLLIASAFAAAYVLAYVVLFAPAGIGVREGLLVLFLSPVMGAAPAGAISVIARVWMTAVELIPAAALWALHLGRTVSGAGVSAEVADAARSGKRLTPPGAP